MRIGHGYDVHKLVEGRKLILGGVEVPFEKGLLGHSDADVLAHAVMDALLGAAGLGDIGRHFPDSDPAYAGADSLVLAGPCGGPAGGEGLAGGQRGRDYPGPAAQAGPPHRPDAGQPGPTHECDSGAGEREGHHRGGPGLYRPGPGAWPPTRWLCWSRQKSKSSCFGLPCGNTTPGAAVFHLWFFWETRDGTKRHSMRAERKLFRAAPSTKGRHRPPRRKEPELCSIISLYAAP